MLKSGMYSDSSSAGDDDPHDDQQRRLDDRDEAAEIGLDLLVVEVGQAVQHFLQRAGLLPDFHHLDGDVRETRRCRSWPPPGPALRAPAARRCEARARCTGSGSSATRYRWRSPAECRRRAASPASAPPGRSRNFCAIVPSIGILERPAVEADTVLRPLSATPRTRAAIARTVSSSRPKYVPANSETATSMRVDERQLARRPFVEDRRTPARLAAR